jgi:hypothetical protein
MTQNEKVEIPAAEVTAELLRTSNLDDLVVVTPSGKRFGEKAPSLTFGLGSHEGDYDGFAEWLRSQA